MAPALHLESINHLGRPQREEGQGWALKNEEDGLCGGDGEVRQPEVGTNLNQHFFTRQKVHWRVRHLVELLNLFEPYFPQFL